MKYQVTRAQITRRYGVANPLNAPWVSSVVSVTIKETKTAKAGWAVAVADQDNPAFADTTEVTYTWDVRKA